MVTLAGCYVPTTTHPVGTTVGLKSDSALLGMWKAEPDPDNHRSYYYDLLNAKDGAIFAVLVPDRGDASDVMMFKFSSARMGNFGFLNVRVMTDPAHEATDQPAGTVPALYRFEANGRLKIFLPNEDALKDAIRAHKIAGTADASGSGDVVVTAEGAVLDKFFRSPAGLALFKKPFAVLTRVK
jgi:hypothetical protein